MFMFKDQEKFKEVVECNYGVKLMTCVGPVGLTFIL